MPRPDHAAERLRGYLAAYLSLYPGGLTQLDRWHLDPQGMQYPEWCYVPMGAAHALAEARTGGAIRAGRIRPGLAAQLATAHDAAVLAALAAWRPGQGVYRFDPDLLAALWTTPVTGDLPSEVLFRLPEYALYLEAPAGVTWEGRPLLGAFVHLEWDVQARRAELRLLLDFEGGLTYLMPMPVHLGGTLDEALATLEREAMRQQERLGVPDVLRPPPGARASLRQVIEPLVSLLLYVCSDRAEYAGPRTPARASAQQVRRAQHVQRDPGVTWVLGRRLGASLRAAATSPGGGQAGRTVRPHLRAAHWTTVWLGKRDGSQRPAARWIPPIVVRADLLEEERPVVIHPVRDAE